MGPRCPSANSQMPAREQPTAVAMSRARATPRARILSRQTNSASTARRIAASLIRPEAATPEQSGAFLGVFTQPIKEDMKDHLRLTTEKGALVTQVMPDSPAAKAGVAELDVITRLGDTAVTGPQDRSQPMLTLILDGLSAGAR